MCTIYVHVMVVLEINAACCCRTSAAVAPAAVIEITRAYIKVVRGLLLLLLLFVIVCRMAQFIAVLFCS